GQRSRLPEVADEHPRQERRARVNPPVLSSVAPLKTRSRAEAGTRKSHAYRPLPKEFRGDGFTYRQIAREGGAAIYEQTWNGCSNPNVAYEVVRVRRRAGFWIGDRLVEASEVYPKSEDWGADGWTLTDKRRAFVKFRELRECQP